MVYKDENGEYKLKDRCAWEEVYSSKNELKTIFKNGELFNQTTLTAIRSRINNYLEKEMNNKTTGTGVLTV